MKRTNPLACDENRTPSKVQDLMRDAAQEHSGDVGQTPGTHHDEVHIVLSTDAYDLVRNETVICVDPHSVSVSNISTASSRIASEKPLCSNITPYRDQIPAAA